MFYKFGAQTAVHLNAHIKNINGAVVSISEFINAALPDFIFAVTGHSPITLPQQQHSHHFCF